MIYLVCFVGCILAYLCHLYLREAREKGETKTFRFIFATNCFQFLVPCVGVALFYIALGLSLRGMASDEVTLETLRLYESRILWLKETLKLLRLSSGYSFLLLVGCFLLSLAARYLALSNQHSDRINKSYGLFEKYNKWIKRASITVALLASFTFFGGQASSPPKELEARIRSMVEQYNGYHEEVENAVSESLLNEAYLRLATSTAFHYQQWSKIDETLRTNNERLKDHYHSAKTNYGLVASKAESLAGKPASRRVELNKLLPESVNATKQAPRSLSPPPDQARFISNQKLRDLKASLHNYSGQLAIQTESVLDTPLGRRLAPNGLKSFLSHKSIPLLKALGEQYPIIDLLLPIFTDTLNQKVGEGINDLSRKIAHKTITNQGNGLESEVRNGVNEILKQTPVEWPMASSEVFTSIEASTQYELHEVNAARVEFESLLRIEEAKLRGKNRELLVQVRNHWEESVRNYKPDPFWNRLGSFKPAKGIPRGAMKQAINDFIAATQRIQEPLTQNEVLRSTLAVLEGGRDFDYKVSELKTIAENSLTGTSAVTELARVESAIQPKIKFANPEYTFPHQLPGWGLTPGFRMPPGYRPPPGYRLPPIYKPPPTYKPPRVWFRR